jgi:hypothetical protein
MGFVTRRVGNRGPFFDLLRRIVLRCEKDRENAPVSHCQSRIIHNPTVSQEVLNKSSMIYQQPQSDV